MHRLLLVCCLVACDTTPQLDTAVDIYTGPTEIDDVEPGICDGETWLYKLETVGWAGSATLDIQQTGVDQAWNEQHTLVSVELDPNRWWDQLARTLVITTDPDAVTKDVSTLFGCAMVDTMTFLIQVYDTEGAFAECAVWGADVSFFLNQTAFATCTDLSEINP